MVPRIADGIMGWSLKFRLPEEVVTLAMLEGESDWAGVATGVGTGVGVAESEGSSVMN